ncbi:MAG: hypothetical protein ABSD03_18020, partial [Vulcanimicrobiaceae bacterium]
MTDASNPRDAASIATTSVNVPPTSIPTRSVRPLTLPVGEQHVGNHRQLDAAAGLKPIEERA